MRSHQFTLVRHGESVGNANNFSQGQKDFPLSELGKKQANALGSYWKNTKMVFDQIVSSPLSRARETAEIISGWLGSCRVSYDPIWMERDSGKRAGLKEEEAECLYPRPAFLNPFQPIGETGESRWELFLRAGNAVQKMVRLPAGNYLIVSHGAMLNMVMYAILGIVPQANSTGVRFRFDNTAFVSVIYDPDEHHWIVTGFNKSPHLELIQSETAIGRRDFQL